MSAVELLSPAEAVPSNPEWHRLRRQGISASEIAQVLGISPWGSAFSLYWQKREGWGTEGTPEMDAGRRAEPVVAQWFEDEGDPHENLVIRPAGLYAHPERLWQLATPDRLVHLPCMHCDGAGVLGDYDRGVAKCSCYPSGLGSLAALLECKYVIGGWDGWGEPWTDDIPVYYRAQGLWQADVLGVDVVYFAAWHGAEFRCYTIRRDKKDLRVMRAAGAEFMRRLEAGEPPDVDGHAATVRALKSVHPSIEDREQDITPATAEGYRRSRALKARAEKMADLFEARLRAEMGPARRAVCDGRFIASRSVFERTGEDYDLHALDEGRPTVDRLNPARSKK